VVAVVPGRAGPPQVGPEQRRARVAHGGHRMEGRDIGTRPFSPHAGPQFFLDAFRLKCAPERRQRELQRKGQGGPLRLEKVLARMCRERDRRTREISEMSPLVAPADGQSSRGITLPMEDLERDMLRVHRPVRTEKAKRSVTSYS